jgi:glycosyltransferase involved in cell wall biosynthesis
VSVVAVSTGHRASDHRIFDKEGRTLAEAGFDVSIVAAHPERERRDGIELVPLPSSGGRLGRFLVRPWRALWLVRRQKAAVVHIHDAELLQICPILKVLGTPVVIYDVHEDFANLMLHRDWIPPFLRSLVRAVVSGCERLLVGSVDAIVAATQPLADRFPGQPRVALYNLPTQRFIERAGAGAAPPSERSTDVVHVGVLSSQRLQFLGETLSILLATRPGTRVLIVGLPPAQRGLMLELTGSAGVEVRGTVSHEEVARLVQGAKVGVNVHPYLHPHLEVAVPVKVFEYMAAGCAVVTSWLPELDNLLDPGAMRQMSVIREPDPARYAAEIAAWLDDPERLDSATRSLRDTVRDSVSWDSQAPRLVGLYDDLVASRAST